MTGLKRFFVMMLSLAVCFVLQTAVLVRIPYLPALPNLLLIAVMSVGFLFGKAFGLGTGVLAGLLLDIFGTGIPGFYTLVLAWLGYFDGFFSEKMESELIPVLYLMLTANELVFHLYQFVFAFLIRRRFELLPYIRSVFLPEFFLTLVCFILIYGVLIFVSKRWDLKVHKGEVKIAN